MNHQTIAQALAKEVVKRNELSDDLPGAACPQSRQTPHGLQQLQNVCAPPPLNSRGAHKAWNVMVYWLMI